MVPELVGVIASEIGEHARELTKTSGQLCGYAAVPNFYGTAFDTTPSFSVAYSYESDIQEHDSLFDRYSVDDWDHRADEFPHADHAQEGIYEQFRKLHNQDPSASEFDAVELAFFDQMYRAVLEAMKRLRDGKTFSPEVFVAVWIRDLEEFTDQSVKELNSLEAYQQYLTAYD